MSDFFKMIYVKIRPNNNVDDFPVDIVNIRDWLWHQSAHVRLFSINPDKVCDNLENIKLIILDWPSRDANIPRLVYHKIRAKKPELPILIVKSDSGSEPIRDSVRYEKYSHIVANDNLTESRVIVDAFKALSIEVPLLHLDLELIIDPNDLEITEVLHWIGKDTIKLSIQKFFPTAKQARLWSVGGGWSGTKLCQIFIPAETGNLYFIKFYTDSEEYRTELLNHTRAKKWLGKYLVDLRFVPGLDLQSQIQAFPPTSPCIYPVCYKSASHTNHERVTLKKVYETNLDGSFINGTVRKLLEILSRNPSTNIRCKEVPWKSSNNGNPSNSCFTFSPNMKRIVLGNINDLRHYGPALCGTNDNWDKQCYYIMKLIYQNLPGWLGSPSSVREVVRGHIHGDPNPRNIIINPEDFNDIKFIDCGGYKPDGRLVSDIAIIERDIKLVIMATDEYATKFYDIDTPKLSEWCLAEKDSIQKGINYTPKDANTLLKGNPSTKRAYYLVGIVRQKAKKLCGDWDKEGIHYFAALLYWTLDILKYNEVRRTKKLLALYSASEILGRFEDIC